MPAKPPDDIDSFIDGFLAGIINKPKPKPAARKKPVTTKKPVDKDEDPKNDATPVKKPKHVRKKNAPKKPAAAVVDTVQITDVVPNENNVIKLEIQGVKMEISLKPGQGLASAKITDSNAAVAPIAQAPAKPKNKKKTIPKCVKIDCWNHWIGKAVGESKCLCCGIREIGQNNFECGHIVSEAKGGGMTVDNLKPICGVCNKSMQTMNMDDFKKAHYPCESKKATSPKKKPEISPVDKRKEHIKGLLANGVLTKCPGKKKEDTPLTRMFDSAYGKIVDRSFCAKAWRDNFSKHCDECGNHFAWRLCGSDDGKVCPCIRK